MPKFFGLIEVTREEHTLLLGILTGVIANVIFNYIVKPYTPPAPLEPTGMAGFASR